MMKPYFLLYPALLGACTAESWYSGLQQRAENECRAKPGDQAQRCDSLKKQSYQDYEEERQNKK